MSVKAENSRNNQKEASPTPEPTLSHHKHEARKDCVQSLKSV